MADWLDLFQFMNKASTGAEYASCTLLNLVMQHLELVKSLCDYVRHVFVFLYVAEVLEPFSNSNSWSQ